MRWDNMYLAGTGVCFPGQVSVETAVTEGRYDRREAERTRQLAVTVAESHQRSPDLAIAAARQALQSAAYAPSDVALLLHAVVMHAGIDLWNSASYIQRQVATAQCLVAEVRSACNGALVGLELACSHLRARPEHHVALITASDCWPGPVIDRWRTDPDLPLGDGASACIVSSERGFARILAMSTTTDPDLEGLQRGHDPFGPWQHDAQNPIDMRKRARQFFATMPKPEMWRRYTSGIRSSVHHALAEADVALTDIAQVVLPFNGRHAVQTHYLDQLDLDINRTTWQFGRRIGHIGAGDQFVALHQLVASQRLHAGDLILVIGEGGGFIWTAVVLELVDRQATGGARSRPAAMH